MSQNPVQPLKILVTYGWCRTSYAILKSLNAAGHHVYSCDSSPLAMTRFSRHCMSFIKTPDPFEAPEAYARKINEICTELSIDFIFPGHEDALVLQKHLSGTTQAKILSASQAQLTLGLSKLSLMRTAQEISVPIPKTYFPSTHEDASQIAHCIDYPAIVKCDRGNSGRGVALVTDPESLLSTWTRMISEWELPEDACPMIQEYVEGSVYGYCFLARHGEILGSFTEAYYRCKDGSMGTSVYRGPIQLIGISDHIKRLVRQMNWHGIGHFDLIGNPNDGNLKLLEMNPRPWGAINLSIINGFNFPQQYLDMHRTDNCTFPPDNTTADKTSVWILGELIAIVQDLIKRRNPNIFGCFQRIITHAINGRCDDFQFTDPLPFFAQSIKYLHGFITGGFSTTPNRPSMMT